MKFLLELVACCGSTTASSSLKDDDEAEGSHGRGGDGRQSEETRVLMAIQCKRRKKRGRVGTTSGNCAAATADWKPTLSSISEDNMAVVAKEKAERAVKRKSSGGGRGGGGSRHMGSYNEDRRNHFTVIPTFSPTPFMI